MHATKPRLLPSESFSFRSPIVAYICGPGQWLDFLAGPAGVDRSSNIRTSGASLAEPRPTCGPICRTRRTRFRRWIRTSRHTSAPWAVKSQRKEGGRAHRRAPLHSGWPGRDANVRFGSLADIGERISDVRFTPRSRHTQRRHRCPLSAKSGHASSAGEVCAGPGSGGWPPLGSC